MTGGPNRGSEVELAELVLKQLRADYLDVVTDGDTLRGWDGSHWAKIPRSKVFDHIRSWDGKPTQTKNARPIKLSNGAVSGIEKLMLRSATLEGFFDDPETGIPCRNGFLIIKEDETDLIVNDPSHRNRYCLDVTWTGEVVDPEDPKFLLNRYLHGCFRGDVEAAEKRAVLQETAGAILLGGTVAVPNPKIVILFGPKAGNGKSQFLEMVRGLVPEDAQACLSPAQLADERMLALLPGKILNAADEIGDQAIASEKLKAVAHGNKVTARPLYQDGFFFVPRAQHVYTANAFPTFKSGMDRGVLRRLLVVVFDRVIPQAEQFKDIGNFIVRHELEALFLWAVEGAQRLLRNGRFTPIASSRDAIADWSRSNDSIGEWLGDPDAVLITGKPCDLVLLKEAYQKYIHWCRDQNIRDIDTMSQTKFTRQINQERYPGIAINRRSDGKRLSGVTLATKSDS